MVLSAAVNDVVVSLESVDERAMQRRRSLAERAGRKSLGARDSAATSLSMGSVANAQQGEHVHQDEERERLACSCPGFLVPRAPRVHTPPAVFTAKRCERDLADMSSPVIRYARTESSTAACHGAQSLPAAPRV